MEHDDVGNTTQLFCLESVDQDSSQAVIDALQAEADRVRSLPDYEEVLTHHTRLVQELDLSGDPIEQKVSNFLEERADEVVEKLQEAPADVPESAKAFAERFYGVPLESEPAALIEARDRYRNYMWVLLGAEEQGESISGELAGEFPDVDESLDDYQLTPQTIDMLRKAIDWAIWKRTNSIEDSLDDIKGLDSL